MPIGTIESKEQPSCKVVYGRADGMLNFLETIVVCESLYTNKAYSNAYAYNNNKLCASSRYPTAAFVLVATKLVELLVGVRIGAAATLHSPLVSFIQKNIATFGARWGDVRGPGCGAADIT